MGARADKAVLEREPGIVVFRPERTALEVRYDQDPFSLELGLSHPCLTPWLVSLSLNHFQ